MKKVISKISKTTLSGFVLIGATSLCLAFVPFTQGKSGKWTAPPEADKKVNPVASNDQSIAAGKALYGTNCKSCHGAKGKGDGPKSAELDKAPGDFTKDEFSKQSDGSIFWKMSEGRKPMPSIKKDLTEEQRWQVVNYLRTLSAKK